VLQRAPDRPWRLIYRIDQRWVKNNRDPENIWYKVTLLSSPSIDLLTKTFCAALALLGQSTQNSSTMMPQSSLLWQSRTTSWSASSQADLQEREILRGENELPLLYALGAEEKVILRKCSKAGGVTDEPMPKSAFLNIHRNSLTNTGYPCGPSVHGIRRGLGNPEASSLVIRPPLQ
jgi:hypothetical protein